MGRLSGCENLLILNAFTKIYAMAGLRLGWCLCSDTALLQRLQAAAQPWSVNGPAQAAGIAALQDEEYPQRVRALLHTQRPRMAAALQALGVSIRSCENYPGLGPGWYRTAVRTGPENDALLAALAKVLKGQNEDPQE